MISERMLVLATALEDTSWVVGRHRRSKKFWDKRAKARDELMSAIEAQEKQIRSLKNKVRRHA